MYRLGGAYFQILSLLAGAYFRGGAFYRVGLQSSKYSIHLNRRAWVRSSKKRGARLSAQLALAKFFLRSLSARGRRQQISSPAFDKNSRICNLWKDKKIVCLMRSLLY